MPRNKRSRGWRPLFMMLAACLAAAPTAEAQWCAARKPGLASFGGRGKGAAQFMSIGDIAVDDAGNIYVLDLGYYDAGSGRWRGVAIKKFNRDAKLVARLGEATIWGAAGNGGESPANLGVDKRGNLYLTTYDNALHEQKYKKVERVFEPGVSEDEKAERPGTSALKSAARAKQGMTDLAGGEADDEIALLVEADVGLARFGSVRVLRQGKGKFEELVTGTGYPRDMVVGDDFVAVWAEVITEKGQEHRLKRYSLKGKLLAETSPGEITAFAVERNGSRSFVAKGYLFHYSVGMNAQRRLQSNYPEAGGEILAYQGLGDRPTRFCQARVGMHRRRSMISRWYPGKRPPEAWLPSSMVFDSRGRLFVGDGQGTIFDGQGIAAGQLNQVVCPDIKYAPQSLVMDSHDNFYFFEAFGQQVYRWAAEAARKAEKKPALGLGLGTTASVAPNQFFEGDASPAVTVRIPDSYRQLRGLTLSYDLSDTAGQTIIPKTTITPFAGSRAPGWFEKTLPLKADRLGVLVANLELSYEGGLIGSEKLGYSILRRYPEMANSWTNEFELANAMGLKCLRGYPWPSWSDAQEYKGGPFKGIKHFPQFVEWAKENDIQLFFQLGKAAPPGPPAGSYPEEDYEEYAYNMAKSYGYGLKHWETLNEPNISRPRWYIDQVLKPVYRGLKRADPNMKLVAIASCGWQPGWLEGLLAAGGGKYLDAVSFHVFTPGYSAIEESGIAWQAAKEREVIRKYSDGDREVPIWLTETQWIIRHFKQGEDIVRCYIFCESIGIPKTQIYYFMTSVTGFGPEWGLNGQLLAPQTGNGLRSGAMMLRVLGHYTNDKQFKGRTQLEPWIFSFDYANEKERAVVIYTTDFQDRVALKTFAKRLKIADCYGNEEVVTPTAEGKLELHISGRPKYLIMAHEDSVELWDKRNHGPNLALAAMGTTAHSSEEPHSFFKLEHPPWQAIDGVRDKGWGNHLGWVNADPAKSPDELVLTFPHERVVDRVNVYCHSHNSGMPSLADYQVQCWLDEAWVKVAEVKNNTFNYAFTHKFEPVKTSKLRLLITRIDTWAAKIVQVYEVEAFGPWGSDVGMNIIPDWYHDYRLPAGEEKKIALMLANYTANPVAGSVRPFIPGGGEIAGGPQRFQLGAGEEKTLHFMAKPTGGRTGTLEVRAELNVDGQPAMSFTGARFVRTDPPAAAATPGELPENREARQARKDAAAAAEPKKKPAAPIAKKEPTLPHLRRNARNDWSNGSLQALEANDSGALTLELARRAKEIAALAKGGTVAATGAAMPGQPPRAAYDGNAANVWATASRTCNDMLRRREETPAKVAANAGNALLDDADDGLLGVDLADIGRTSRWEMKSTVAIEAVRTVFADDSKVDYDIFLSKARSPGDDYGPPEWQKVASREGVAGEVTDHLAAPVRARHVVTILRASDPGKKAPLPLSQQASAPVLIRRTLLAPASVFAVETLFAKEAVCEYELYVSAKKNPSAALKPPDWTKVAAAKRGHGLVRDTFAEPMPVAAIATKIVAAETISGMFSDGGFEGAADHGDGNPVNSDGFPIGEGDVALDAAVRRTGKQAVRIAGKGILAKQGIGLPLNYLGPFRLSFYGKGKPTIWTVTCWKLAVNRRVRLAATTYQFGGSNGWVRHAATIAALAEGTSDFSIEATIDAKPAGTDAAWIDDVSLHPGQWAPSAHALIAEQKVYTPHQYQGQGAWTSRPFFVGSDKDLALNLKWAAKAPGETSLRVQTRTGASRETEDGAWSPWHAYAGGGGKFISVATPRQNFLQCRVEMKSENSLATPELTSLVLTHAAAVPVGTMYAVGLSSKIEELVGNLARHPGKPRESAWAQFEIGRLYAVMGNYVKAVAEYRKVLAGHPGQRDWCAEAALEMARNAQHTGNTGEAKTAYQALIKEYASSDSCREAVRLARNELNAIARKDD